MRSLWPVIWGSVLAAACGRPNPGFKLADSSDPVDSDGQSASGGLTDTASMSSAPTSTDPTAVTTGSEGTTGTTSAASATATSDPTGDTGATTMVDGKWVFPAECAEHLQSEFTAAAADTFFVNENPLGECSWLMNQMGDYPNCQDLQFSKASVFELFLSSDEDFGPQYDYVGIYAVRFAMPKPLHAGEIEIPEAAFLAVEARIQLFRPFDPNPKPWTGVKLDVRRFTQGDSWIADEGLEFTPCNDPRASYRCQVCAPPGAEVNQPCTKEWGEGDKPHDGVPYDPADEPIQELNQQVEPDAGDGYSLLLKEFKKDDLVWLTTQGLMLMPGLDTPRGTIEVKTLDLEMPEWVPALRVHYCEPYFMPS